MSAAGGLQAQDRGMSQRNGTAGSDEEKPSSTAPTSVTASRLPELRDEYGGLFANVGARLVALHSKATGHIEGRHFEMAGEGGKKQRGGS